MSPICRLQKSHCQNSWHAPPCAAYINATCPTLVHSPVPEGHTPTSGRMFSMVIIATNSIFPSEYIWTTFSLWVSRLRYVSTGYFPLTYWFVAISLCSHRICQLCVIFYIYNSLVSGVEIVTKISSPKNDVVEKNPLKKILILFAFQETPIITTTKFNGNKNYLN